jgi:hypothetical protein
MSNRLFCTLPYAVMAASVGLSGFVALAPAPDRPIAAFFPPWWTVERTFSAAAISGAPIVRFGGLSNVVVLSPAMPDLSRRLWQAGAWLLLDAQAVGACTEPV